MSPGTSMQEPSEFSASVLSPIYQNADCSWGLYHRDEIIVLYSYRAGGFRGFTRLSGVKAHLRYPRLDIGGEILRPIADFATPDL